MSELRKALEPFAAIWNNRKIDDKPGTGKYTLVLVEHVKAAAAALSKDEAGEAALAGAWEKGREAARLEALRVWRDAPNVRTDDILTSFRQNAVAAGCIESAEAIRALPNPYKIPTVNGTDEPPNAIPDGRLPSDAGRTDEWSIAAKIVTDFAHQTMSTQALANLESTIARALREAGGRVEPLLAAAEQAYADGELEQGALYWLKERLA